MLLPTRLLASFLLLGVTLAGGLALAHHRTDVGHSFERVARRTAADATDQVTMSPLHATSLVAVTDGRHVNVLEATFQPRADTDVRIDDLLLTVRGRSVLVQAHLGDPGVSFHSLRDRDGSIAEGRIDDTDILEVDLDLEALGARLAPHEAAEVVVEAPHAQPLRLAFDVPATLGHLVDLEPYERI